MDGLCVVQWSLTIGQYRVAFGRRTEIDSKIKGTEERQSVMIRLEVQTETMKLINQFHPFVSLHIKLLTIAVKILSIDTFAKRYIIHVSLFADCLDAIRDDESPSSSFTNYFLILSSKWSQKRSHLPFRGNDRNHS